MQYDVMIIGGGIVGATLACALGKTQLNVALVDRDLSNHANDARLIALNDGSIALLENLSLWSSLVSIAEPIKKVHVSKQKFFGAMRMDAERLGLKALGYVVPAKEINKVLYAAIKSIPHLTLLEPAVLAGLQQDDQGITVTIEKGHEINTYTTRFLIGADGSYSKVRTLLNIPTKITNYQQSALVTEVELKREHENIAYERFHEQGVIAMLPLKGMRVACIWTDHKDTIDTLLTLNDEEFLLNVQKKFGFRLGRLQKVGKRAKFPLQMILAETQKKDRIFLMGNAAHTLHPVASQGLNLALYEAAMFVEHFQANHDFSFDETVFIRAQQISRSLSHTLPALFSSDFFIKTIFRQTAMMGFDIFDFANRCFTKAAMGKIGKVPRLMLREN